MMIAALPHDIQSHVWQFYRQGLQGRREERFQQLAENFFEQVEALCNHDTAASGFLLDWMAGMLQFPNRKPSKGVVLVGHETLGVVTRPWRPLSP